MIPTPKQRFQQGQGSIVNHNALVQSPQFETSTDAAMLEYADQLSRMRTGDVNMAAAAGFKLAGAYEFLTVLKDLGSRPSAPSKPVPDNLEP